MNNRFTLPISLAVAVHASLLLGFRHAGPAPVTAPLKPAEKLFPDTTIKMVPIVDPADPADPSTTAKGTPKPDIARSEEPPPIPSDISISVPTSRTTRSFSDALTFDPQPFGLPDGDVRVVSDRIGIVSVSSLDRTPRAQVQSPPDYPFAAKREGVEGEVLVEFLVDENGRVSSPSVVRSTNEVFNEASLRAVSRWRFEAGRRDGRIVRFRMSVPVVFRVTRD